MPEMVKTFTDRKHCDEIFVANLYCRKNLIKITLHGGISLPKLKKKINPELRRKNTNIYYGSIMKRLIRRETLLRTFTSNLDVRRP